MSDNFEKRVGDFLIKCHGLHSDAYIERVGTEYFVWLNREDVDDLIYCLTQLKKAKDGYYRRKENNT
jgi:hypothetical protein